MSFVSYAQNREDVMLRRALADVAQGFYVDIGAQDPHEFSVTKTFYEAGWRGINVEPVNHWYEKLVRARPEDINIRAMIGMSDQPVEFFEIEGTGLSTGDKAQAEIYRNAGRTVTQTAMTPIRLDMVLATHNVGVIHFLKVDVEGSEDDVLRSIDLRTWRPWIIVIEATIPMSPELSACIWQEYVEGASYEFVYFDGLNKYFVSKEKHGLKRAFSTPPNVFDLYITAGEKENEENIEKLAAEGDRSERLALERNFALLDNKRLNGRLSTKRMELQSLGDDLKSRRTELDSARDELRSARDELQSARGDLESRGMELQTAHDDLEAKRIELGGLRAQIHLIQNSLSWRVTRPLRAVRGACRNFLIAHSGVRRTWLTVRPIVARVLRTIIK